jgi:hypothetical protein
MGKILITIGFVLTIAGILIQYGGRIPFFGKLPGDIRIEHENFRFYFPLATCIGISLLISFILFVINKLKN